MTYKPRRGKQKLLMGEIDSEKRKKSFFGNPLQVHYVDRLTTLISGSTDEWSLSQEIEHGMATAHFHTKHFPASVITFNTFPFFPLDSHGISWPATIAIPFRLTRSLGIRMMMRWGWQPPTMPIQQKCNNNNDMYYGCHFHPLPTH